MDDDKVKQLAETLKKQGLAASMYEALQKARTIMDVKEDVKEEAKQPGEYGITGEKGSLNDVMKQAGVDPAEVDAKEKEKSDEVKGDVNAINDGDANPAETEQIKEEIGAKETDTMAEPTAEEKRPNQDDGPEDNPFKKEKSIDLTKVFNFKK
jgi:hypothetical protein